MNRYEKAARTGRRVLNQACGRNQRVSAAIVAPATHSRIWPPSFCEMLCSAPG